MSYSPVFVATLALVGSFVLIKVISSLCPESPRVHHEHRHLTFRTTAPVEPVQTSTNNVPQPVAIEDPSLPTPPVSSIPSSRSSVEGEMGLYTDNLLYAINPNARYSETLPSNASAGERKCAEICASLFGSDKRVLYQYRDQNLQNPDTQRSLEFDIFYPELRFAVEYQGQQHYRDSEHFNSRAVYQMARDQLKAVRAREFRICLVTIPYTYTNDQIRTVIRGSAIRHGIAVILPPT